MGITARDKEEWYHHPVTQQFLQGLVSDRYATMETWARQGYTAETPEKTVQANATALGGVEVLAQVIDLIEDCRNAVEKERA